MEPVLKNNIWGGNRLKEEFGYEGAGDCTGECWGISAHPNGDCLIREGIYAGKHLSQLYGEHRELFGNIDSEQFPLLTKIIDARENLSIQVHPDDLYAHSQEGGSRGKTECWYVMDCPENAHLILGHNAATRWELRDMLEKGRYRELIREIPVKKGDFIQIWPGTVHAIEAGFLLLETQQSSDITYRIYDYDRLDGQLPRPLHVKKGLDVIRVPDNQCGIRKRTARSCPVNQMNLLVECEYYRVWKLDVDGEVQIEQSCSFLMASVIDGEGSIDTKAVRKGDHFIVPAGYGHMRIEGKMEWILSSC